MIPTLSVETLTAMLRPHMDAPTWPGLDDPRTPARAADYARAHGIWDALAEQVRPDEPLTTMRRSLFRTFKRHGQRTAADAAYRDMIGKLEQAALALWLDHPAASLDEVQDRMWAYCDLHTWIMPAHEYVPVDLGSTRIANLLSELLWLFRDRIEDEVRDRVRAAVEDRVLAPSYDYRTGLGWRTNDMNWNAVCNGNVISAALYHFAHDVDRLAIYLQPIIPRLQFAIDGFCDDGSCREGAGYWNYGFGHLVDAAIVLHQRTGGALNLMDTPKMRRICEFPLAVQIDGPVRASFGDCKNGLIDAGTALRINRFHAIPELYAAAGTWPDGTLKLSALRDLAIYGGERVGERPPPCDATLPVFGFTRLCTPPDATRPATLCALAGCNNLPHNHNDIGCFIFYRDGVAYLTDIGSPLYTAKTFGPRRYEIIQCRSLGHSVPFVNGQEQAPGSDYYGALSVPPADTDGAKTAVIDMTHAYPEQAGLERLSRTLTLGPDGALELEDAFAFGEQPDAVQEIFITLEPATATPDGRAVRIGPEARLACLVALDTEGRFAVETLDPEGAGEPGDVITRITFTPDTLAPGMTMRFRVD